jgi:hypothetical protein
VVAAVRDVLDLVAHPSVHLARRSIEAASMMEGYLRCGTDPCRRHDDLNKSGGDVINQA